MKKFIAICVLSLLTACEKGPKISSEQLSLIRTIGVVSASSDTFYGTMKGFTVYQNEGFHQPTSEWHIASQLETALVGQLNQCGYAARMLSYDRTALLSSYIKPREKSVFSLGALEGKPLQSFSPSYDVTALKASLIKLGEREKVDVVVGILEHSDIDPPIKLMIGLYGLSIDNMPGLKKSYMYVNPTIVVLDVKTGKQLAWSDAEFISSTPGGIGGYRLDAAQDVEMAWKPSFADYTSAEQNEMRAIIKEKIPSVIRNRIDATGLCHK